MCNSNLQINVRYSSGNHGKSRNRHLQDAQDWVAVEVARRLAVLFLEVALLDGLAGWPVGLANGGRVGFWCVS